MDIDVKVIPLEVLACPFHVSYARSYAPLCVVRPRHIGNLIVEKGNARGLLFGSRDIIVVCGFAIRGAKKARVTLR